MFDEARAWRAVLDRDARWDRGFVFAVVTTGIYCRPSCPARRPKPENVRFFPSSTLAAAGGFRPCKRCRPDQNIASLAERAKRLLDAASPDSLSLSDLARRLRISPFHLQRVFKKEMGVSPKQYADARRVERFRQRLRAGSDVTSATYDSGYGSGSGPYADVKRDLAMSPGEYRRGGQGVTIRYALASTSIGRVILAMTDRGVCALSFGDDHRGLIVSLRREYPNASLVRSKDQEITRAIRSIQNRIKGLGDATNISLDLNATKFQMMVWQALRHIPRGETRSYGEIAAGLGRPSSSRAVARACAANRIAYLVPCHRVIRRDGGLGGYRWGTDRKRELLRQEKKQELTR
jgi:AraC family transcriptional regulator of adaptative response/methylated-DNA-[protein]-cysteine methyltransferase